MNIIGQVIAGLIAGRMQGEMPGSGLFANQKPPKYVANAYYRPIGWNLLATGQATTATRVHYTPFVVWEAHTFQGASIYNTGTGDNGKKIRLMVFRDDNVSGGPGTLEKDFGEITLTGAAALRTLTSSWAAAPGKYYFAVWTETNPTLTIMTPYHFMSGVGIAVGPSQAEFIGTLQAPSNADTAHTNFHYVDSTYGVAPNTAVAPTTSIVYPFTTSAGQIGNPAWWLKG